jgi:hypothetical protein
MGISQLGHRPSRVKELEELVLSHPGLVKNFPDGLAELVQRGGHHRGCRSSETRSSGSSRSSVPPGSAVPRISPPGQPQRLEVNGTQWAMLGSMRKPVT